MTNEYNRNHPCFLCGQNKKVEIPTAKESKDAAHDIQLVQQGVPLDVPIYAVSSRRFSVQRDGWNGIVVYKDKESRDMIDMLLARVKKLEDVVYGKDNKNDT